MEYLIRSNSKKPAHIWIDGDTACRMVSTGGIVHTHKYVKVNELDRRVCKMCQTNWIKRMEG